MSNINLRPPEFTREREFYWPRLVFVVGIIFYAAVLIFSAVYLHNIKLEEKVKLAVLKEEYRLVELELSRIEKEVSLFNEIRQRREDLDRILSLNRNWHSSLDLILNNVGTDININQFRGTETGSFSFTASSLRLTNIAVYLFTLQDAEIFQRISYKQIDRHNGLYYNFSFEGKLGLPGEVSSRAEEN
ncbi:MAG: hypothetical protein CVU88_02890 [Firmicutes bacterium HGW-Firmicutes-13]|nr:MAG: hypothetical protein CVU88_02890 [Firmicutes bacterium HGW-Firmicutes-13]